MKHDLKPGDLLRSKRIPDHRNMFIAIAPHPLYGQIWSLCLVHCEIEYYETPGIPFYDFISGYEKLPDQE